MSEVSRKSKESRRLELSRENEGWRLQCQWLPAGRRLFTGPGGGPVQAISPSTISAGCMTVGPVIAMAADSTEKLAAARKDISGAMALRVAVALKVIDGELRVMLAGVIVSELMPTVSTISFAAVSE